MLKRSIYLCVVAMLFCVSSARGVSESMSLDALADICEAAESAVFDAVVEYETYNDPAPKLKDIAGSDNLGIIKGRAKRIWAWASPQPSVQWCKSTTTLTVMNENGDTWDSVITQSYDGDVAKRHQIDGWPNRRSTGTVTNRRHFMPLKCTTPLAFTVLRDQEPSLSVRLRDKNLVHLLYDSIEKVNGFETIHVDFFAHIEDKDIICERVYFAVDYGFLPVKIEYFAGRGTPTLTVEVFEFEKVKEGLWFPKRARLVSPADPAYVYEAQKIVVNQGLKKEYFDIDFPAGTKVYDEISGVRYVVGVGQSADK